MASFSLRKSVQSSLKFVLTNSTRAQPQHYHNQQQALWRLYSTTTTTTPPPSTDYNKDVLKNLVRTNKVVIFMKGNPEAPRCGFSNAVVQILRMHGVAYDAHDVLLSDELRQAIKEFSDWPTIPQVYINGEFIGGCDILLQMHQSGDLIEELKKVGIESQLLKDATNAANEQQQQQKNDNKK